MSASDDSGAFDEQALVRLYMELTGASEPHARSVFMYVVHPENHGPAPVYVTALEPVAETEEEEPSRSRGRHRSTTAVLAIAIAFLALAGRVEGGTVPLTERSTAGGVGEVPVLNAAPAPKALLTNPLSLAEAVDVALRQNPGIQAARKEVEAARGIVIQTRAIAVPKLNVAGNYSAAEEDDIDSFQTPGGFRFGNSQNWASQIKVVQSLYEGGRLLSSFRVARLTREQAMLKYQTVVANTILAVQLAYLDVLLASQQIVVQEASIELLSRELADANRRFEAGTVARFNVLRAEVELANARPPLIRARNSLRIGKNNLANLLGFDVPREVVEEIPMTLTGKLEAAPYELDLQRAIATALERRTELGTLRKAEALRKEEIISAKAGYKPSLQAYGGYDAHNSMLTTDLSRERHGWIAGVQLNWSLFDGARTRGKVIEAVANHEKAGIELEDTGRRIELEVRTAYSSFIEARELLESQKKVFEQAEEALRLARSRNEAGTGTQLDVLGAQTSLTAARTTQAQALHDYEAARVRLERAVGNNIVTETGSGAE